MTWEIFQSPAGICSILTPTLFEIGQRSDLFTHQLGFSVWKTLLPECWWPTCVLWSALPRALIISLLLPETRTYKRFLVWSWIGWFWWQGLQADSLDDLSLFIPTHPASFWVSCVGRKLLAVSAQSIVLLSLALLHQGGLYPRVWRCV